MSLSDLALQAQRPMQKDCESGRWQMTPRKQHLVYTLTATHELTETRTAGTSLHQLKADKILTLGKRGGHTVSPNQEAICN